MLSRVARTAWVPPGFRTIQNLPKDGRGQAGHSGAQTAARCRDPRTTVQAWRRIMKALIAALALAALIAVPMFAQPANAAPVSPSSSSFGSNGY
jgi:hypothetical protein